MRLSAVALAAGCILSTLPATAAQTAFPYKAYVAVKDVYVRSGPGDQFYPTKKLQPGAEVEVYREDPGGWLAIRPLPESYSWISARFLKPGRDGAAEVTVQGAVARVGSQFSDIREVVQVRLDRGELVEVRETKQIGSGDAATLWCKIAPPAGEFRWVHAKYMESAKPRQQLAPGDYTGGNHDNTGGSRNNTGEPQQHRGESRQRRGRSGRRRRQRHRRRAASGVRRLAASHRLGATSVVRGFPGRPGQRRH